MRTSSWQEQITLEPILEERPTQFMSVENQRYAFGQILSNQPPRHAHVRLPGSREPVAFVSLDCPEATVAQRFVDRIATRIIARMECALPMEEAVLTLPERSSIAPRAATDEILRQAAAGQRRTRRGPKESDHG